MQKPNIDDYLQNGIYGQKQTKPEERRKFLGTLRERIVVALKKGQVMEGCFFSEIEELLKEHRQAALYLNGDIPYSNLAHYIKMAEKHKIVFSIVSNPDHQTDIGLVLAYDHAIDKEEIYLEKKKPEETKDKQASTSFSIKKILKRKM